MDELYTRFDGVFFEKTRLSMVTLLYREEKVSFNRFKELLGGTDGAIYTHIEKLVKAGYVGKTREIAGTSVMTLYFLTEDGRRAFREYVDFLHEMLKEGTHGAKSDSGSNA